MLLTRWLKKDKTLAATTTTNHKHNCTHEKFKTKTGQGPFLLSYDGRVIPLRKAQFLQPK